MKLRCRCHVRARLPRSRSATGNNGPGRTWRAETTTMEPQIMRMLVLGGDGIGPEVAREALRIARWFVDWRGLGCDFFEEPFGLLAWRELGQIMPARTLEAVKRADGILFGAMGGDEYEAIDHAKRRAGSVLGIRRELDLYANVRPVRAWPQLAGVCPLRAEVAFGTDLVIVRENVGGLYFGTPRGVAATDRGYTAVNTQRYTSHEIERVARHAFELARSRGKRVCSVDKSNVLETGRLWRDTVRSLRERAFPDVELVHMLVDNCALQLVRKPTQFDVIVTDNMFGDILSDCAGAIGGSLGMLPSASFGPIGSDGRRKILYEPIHGSAPDIAGRGVANPIGMILSLAMALRHTLDRQEDAVLLERAVDRALEDGARTADIAGAGDDPVDTVGMGDAVLRALAALAAEGRRRGSPGVVAKLEEQTMTMARTFFEKVFSQHVIADLGDNTALLQMDRLFLHEMSGSTVMKGLESSGRKPASNAQVYAVIDHTLSTRAGREPDETMNGEGGEMIQTTRALSKRYNFTFFDVSDRRQGIVHVIAPELGIALPGLTIVCGDSHTCTVGGIGALAWGVGTTEGEHVLATQTLAQIKPKTMRVNFEGRLPAGVFAKDMVLELIGRHGANGGLGYAVEFAGSTVRAMPVEGRLTICNMAIEFSARYGFVPPDEITIDYLRGREFAPKGEQWDKAVAHWRSLATDPGAVFDREITIDCSRVGPQITWGTSPQQVASIDGHVPDPLSEHDPGARQLLERALRYTRLEPGTPMASIAIDAAYIGSCTNARLSDLRIAAAVLKGRKVAPGVKAICVPGSTQVKVAAEAEGLDRIFQDAGFEWHESACAMCGSGGRGRLADKRVISTTNRNFEGRQGPQTRTHLASPATVAASAIAGRFSDARAFFG
ncbi:MAG: 3-isopropylmalate dehydratase large subunit [Comamonadaceae bacterium]|nr:MAG: 3-isopropylmalate dehydratase large subunit [Comamonadaceae bacterium]